MPSTETTRPDTSRTETLPNPRLREALFADLARDDVFRLETSRLWLRWPRLADAEAMTDLASDARVAEMTARIPHPYPANRAEEAIFSARKANALGEALMLAMARKERPDRLIGMIALHAGDGPDALMLGYWLGKPHWGDGLATEAAQAMIDAGFTLTRAGAIEADARVINPASRRVLEKCGFRHAGSRLAEMPARGGVFPCDAFRLDRKTWASLRNWAALKSWAGEKLGQTRADMPQLAAV